MEIKQDNPFFGDVKRPNLGNYTNRFNSPLFEGGKANIQLSWGESHLTPLLHKRNGAVLDHRKTRNAKLESKQLDHTPWTAVGH